MERTEELNVTENGGESVLGEGGAVSEDSVVSGL